MKKTLITLAVVVSVIGIIALGLLWLLDDPNRFKPQLERLIADNTGYDVGLEGDLSWRLWPPVVLSANDVSFSDETTDYRLGNLAVDAALIGLLSSGGDLVIDELTLRNLVMTDKELGDVTRIDRLSLPNFTPGAPGPLALEGVLQSPDGTETKIALTALATLDMNQDTLKLENMAFDYGGIRGTCEVDLSHLTRDPIIAQKRTREDVLPLDTFRALDWFADCNIPRLNLEDIILKAIVVHSENTAARSNSSLRVPDVAGGSLVLDVDIDARTRTPQWSVRSDADGIQSQQIMDILSPKLHWAAPLLVGGTFKLRGNTPEALANSLNGTAKVDATQGTIDISAIKSSVLALAELAGKAEEIRTWPDRLEYQKFVGDWVVEGKNHVLDFTLENVKLAATGTLDPLAETLDMRGSITVEEHAALETFKINPALYGVPIPVRCQGTFGDPTCSLDRQAAQKTLTTIASRQVRERVDEKVGEALEDKVPEEYRETAREALEGLGGLFKRKKEE